MKPGGCWGGMENENGHVGFVVDALTWQDFTVPERIVQLGQPPLRVEIMTSIDGVLFPDAWTRRHEGRYGDQPVPFIRASGRKQDLLDLEHSSNGPSAQHGASGLISGVPLQYTASQALLLRLISDPDVAPSNPALPGRTIREEGQPIPARDAGCPHSPREPTAHPGTARGRGSPQCRSFR